MKKLKSDYLGTKRALERPLHPVERALCASFRLQIQNVRGPDGTELIFSQPQGNIVIELCGATGTKGLNVTPIS